MTNTNLQLKAQHLQSFAYDLVSNSNTPSIAVPALGVKLVQLCCDNRSDPFEGQMIEIQAHALDIFHSEIGTRANEDIKNIADAITRRGKIFEEQRCPKQANFCRAIALICHAINSTDKFHIKNFVSRACVKAWYAGADYDQIKAAAMLLF